MVRLFPVKKVPYDAVQSITPDEKLKQAKRFFDQGAYSKAKELAKELVEKVPSLRSVAFDATFLLARIFANLGEIPEAERYCRDALRIRPFAASPHFLLANIVHERSDLEQAKDLLKKALYLDHAHISAYLELAALYQAEGDQERARKMRLSALDVLLNLPADSRVENYEEWTVSELTEQVNQWLHGPTLSTQDK